MELLEINKFSELHNEDNIFFTKTEFLQNDFSIISKLKNNVVLISGNSDYPIDKNRMINLPSNVVKWYAQNAIEYHPKLEPLPIGLENKVSCLRTNHGPNYYERAKIKEDLILNKKNIIPNKLIYSNFNINTNFHYRNEVKKICINSNHIDWGEPILNTNDFINKILEYELIVCPIGNGIDTHRLWEILYLGRTPVTIKIGNYKIYELYEKLPIIILNNVNDLSNKSLILKELEKVKNKVYNLELLDFNFWKNKIIKNLN